MVASLHLMKAILTDSDIWPTDSCISKIWSLRSVLVLLTTHFHVFVNTFFFIHSRFYHAAQTFYYTIGK